MNQVMFRSEYWKKPAHVSGRHELLPAILAKLPVIPMIGAPPAQLLFALVCAKHKLTKAEIIGPSRKAPIVKARYELMYLIYTHTAMSLPRMARLLNRDHSTILYGVRKHAGRSVRRTTVWAQKRAKAQKGGSIQCQAL